MRGLEPPRLAALEPKSSASTSSATSASGLPYRLRDRRPTRGRRHMADDSGSPPRHKHGRMSGGVLFVHNSFPAQFADLARTLVARGMPCMAIGSASARGIDGIPLARWSNARGSTPGIFPLATRAEADLIRGRAA